MDKYISNSKINANHTIEHLTLSEKLAESGSSKFVIASITMLSSILFVVIIWSIFTQIDEVTNCKGQISPDDSVQIIQHLEGGVINTVDVKDGSIVSKDQLLFSILPEVATSDLKQLKKRQNATELKLFVLQSLFDHHNNLTTKDFAEVISHPEATEQSLLELQISNAMMLYHQQKQQMEYNRQQLEIQLEKEKKNVQNIVKQIYHYEKRKKVIDDELQIFDTLGKQQATSKLNILNTKDKLQEVIGELLEVVREKNVIESRIIDLQKELQLFEFNQKQLALEEINDLTANLLEIKEQIQKASFRVENLEIRSPIDGIVKGLKINPGTVISPAEILFEIVPISEKMIAKVRISTEDIGHVKIGDDAKVKIDTYDFSTYGYIQGTVDAISASTFLDEENNPYYQLIIELDKNYLGDNPESLRVFPGMTINASITTRSRSVINYLLKPINRTLNASFTER